MSKFIMTGLTSSSKTYLNLQIADIKINEFNFKYFYQDAKDLSIILSKYADLFKRAEFYFSTIKFDKVNELEWFKFKKKCIVKN